MNLQHLITNTSNKLTKKTVQAEANHRVSEVLKNKELGDNTASQFYTYCRGLMEYCKSIIGNDDLKRAIEDEVSQYRSENTDSAMPVESGVIVGKLETRSSGDKYDYSNDEQWLLLTDDINEMEKQLKDLKAKRSDRESMLKAYGKRLYENPNAEKMVTDDGELLEPPKMVKAGEPVIVFKW